MVTTSQRKVNNGYGSAENLGDIRSYYPKNLE